MTYVFNLTFFAARFWGVVFFKKNEYGKKFKVE